MDRRGIALGAALVGVGLYILGARAWGWRGAGPILLLLGAIFFSLSAARRFRGPLLPAGVLLGLGVGFLLRDAVEPSWPRWAAILLGLGGGFLLVAAIDRALGRKREPPPVWPGLVLVALGGAAAATRAVSMRSLFDRLEPLWPFALIAAGILLVATSKRRSAS
jgi:hypothetical protein